MKEKAFPLKEVDWQESQIQGRTLYENQHLGMDLRDYFASKAIQAFCMDTNWRVKSLSYYEDMALNAYKIADAMLKQREI